MTPRSERTQPEQRQAYPLLSMASPKNPSMALRPKTLVCMAHDQASRMQSRTPRSCLTQNPIWGEWSLVRIRRQIVEQKTSTRLLIRMGHTHTQTQTHRQKKPRTQMITECCFLESRNAHCGGPHRKLQTPPHAPTAQLSLHRMTPNPLPLPHSSKKMSPSAVNPMCPTHAVRSVHYEVLLFCLRSLKKHEMR